MTETAAALARRQLVERLLRGEGAPLGTPDQRIAPRLPGTPVPLSPAQRQVWLHAAMVPDVSLYNESVTIHRHGPFDLAVMRACLDALLARHESWRASFTFDGTQPSQHILPTLAIDLPLTDVAHLPADERDAAAVAIATADARQAIDLAQAPLLRARVVRLGAEEHRLYLTLHHIIFDGVAIYGVILPELIQLYEAFAAGLPSPLAPPALGYGDYAVWAAREIAGPALERQRRHWRAALADLPPKLDLAADRGRPPLPTHAGSMEVFALSADLTERLKALARRADATLYMTLLAGFTAMLHHYTGAEDMVVGGVTDLRRRPELQGVVGYFLNTLPLRSRPSAELPFATHLAQVRESVLGALAASELPFDEIVRCAETRASPGAHPLFDILFSVEPPVAPFPPGWDLTQMDVVVGAAKFDLYLELDERPDGMAGRFLYSTERFDAATIRRMIGHWRTLLDAAAADPDCRLADLPLMREAEQPARPPATSFPPDARTVPERIADAARASPGATAVRCGMQRWTYAELDRAADGIAAALRAAGVGTGALVAVVLERAPELVAALVGTLRAGAAYLPLDPRQPVARVRRIADEAAVDALLTERALVGLVPVAGPVLLVEDCAAAGAFAGPPPRPDDLAYVLYTSGSGGAPKGVEIEHGALGNLLAAMADAPGLDASDRLLAVTTISFDIAALELFLPLTRGGEVILAPYEVARDPAALAALIAATRPTVMQATPATWSALLDAGWAGDRRLRVLCGGEALSRRLADRLLARTGAVWNLYGPTETCIWSTCATVSRGGDVVPIGMAIAHTSLHVLDSRGRPVPPGLPGELFIGGAGLARGYRGRPDLTAERFGAFRAGDGERLHRTGDRVREGPGGQLLHLGRVDDQVKIRGFRVAVEEVEGALATHAEVAAAAVRSWPDATGHSLLAAYVVPRPGRTPARAALATHLAKQLPDYMVPSAFTIVADLPMTASGKIDRARLPAPVLDHHDAQFEEPASDTERRLAAIWRDVLGIERIGREDSFFDLGGHSLLAARLLARVSAVWGRSVGMPALIRARRLRELAQMLDGEREHAPATILIQPRGWRPPFLWTEPGPSFVALAEQIGLDQPLLGVPLEPTPDPAGGPRAFREHARAFVEAIRHVQPHGPYYLGGWCVAGILTYAAAVQLEAEGEEVRLLVLGDAFDPAKPPAIDDSLRFRMRFHAAQLLGGAADRRAYVAERWRSLLVRSGLRPAPPHWSHDEGRAMLDVAVQTYTPDRFHGPVLLFQSQDPFTRARMDESWRDRLAGPVTYRQLPGSHETLLFEPHVAEVAALLRAALVDAQSAGHVAARRA